MTRPKVRLFIWTFGLGATLWTPTLASSALIDLSFSMLPSSQGWSYEGINPEVAMFSVTGSTLIMDSRGLADPRGRYTWYGAIDPGRAFSLDFSLRLIDSDNSPVYEWVFYLGAIGPTFMTDIEWSTAKGAGYSFAGAEVEVSPGNTYAVGQNVDTGFLDYRLTAVPGGPLQFLIDGTVVATGRTPNFPLNDLLYFGDTGAGGALVEIRRFRFDQFDQAVPESSSLMLVGLALLCVIAYRTHVRGWGSLWWAGRCSSCACGKRAVSTVEQGENS